MNEKALLNEIYNNLNNGYAYFEHIDSSEKIKYPYDNDVLFIPFFNQGIISWQHYGSSANKNTLKDLKFIIHEIFKMNAAAFIEKYHLKKIYF